MTATVAPGGLLSSGSYLGRVVSRVRVPGFSLTETVYGKGENLPRHAHERAFFCLTVHGAYSEKTLRTGEILYAPWTAVFHPAGETHLTRMGPAGGRVVNVEVDPDRLDELDGLAPPPAASTDLAGGELVWLLARFRRAAHGGDPSAGLDAEAFGVELLACVARASHRDTRRPPWLSRVEERLAERGPEPSVRELAREAGVHPVHVARVFRRVHGVPPGAFRRRLRIRRACVLLGSGRSAADAAAQAGFSDQSHLGRALKGAIGETPGAFRGAFSPPRPPQPGGQAGIARPRSSSSFSR